MWLKTKPYILVLPSFILIAALMVGGIFQGIFQSIFILNDNGSKGISFSVYKKLFKSEVFWESFIATIKISTISTIISAILGTLIILLLFLLISEKKKKQSILLWRLFQIPMLFSYLTCAYTMFLFLTQSGWVSILCYNLGFISDMSEFPILVNDKNSIGIIIAYVWKTTPFIVLMLYPALLKVQDNWIQVAKIFGANIFKTFSEIVLPMLIAPLRTSAFIVFTFIFSAFEVPYLLGVTYPKILGVYSYELYMNGDFSERPLALGINIIICMFIIFISAAYYILNKKHKDKVDNN
ncbi:ABC transporter permease subunit [Clostridium algidicarnis]|uniref:ABC transporter permease subunit n=1 Tax=Clostridium algidicarnis TaxID=37659 RepID=UPI001C0B2F80|nr:ABC transporter permease subunit [Clostridium algidicarnis]MBU3195722.1 ABC transporter permease subunit [Clostridium algidicarnis]MBU3208744.1 ABC transporter permease subunit [Clostridium algidicarnis]MBU3226745.1 ABC transporter permease subunit [Clostridium algidicarnis]MBU3250344.1 ABC transporter permease subunit [Clostridium algidicarnis]